MRLVAMGPVTKTVTVTQLPGAAGLEGGSRCPAPRGGRAFSFGADNPDVILLPASRSECPGCGGRAIPATDDACAHLRAHETALAAARNPVTLEAVLRLHATLKWRGECVCWAEKPEMRGAWNDRVLKPRATER